MSWQIIEYETKRQDRPITLFIKKLRPKTIAKISRLIDLLSLYGPKLSMPYSKKLTSDLYELRVRGKEQIRILYTFLNTNIYLLHCFKKKTDKTPKKEIIVAKQRLKYLTSI